MIFQNIFTWFSTVDWVNVELWGMFGQWAGAIATFIAVLVAMRQIKEAQKQTEYSQKQADTAIRQTELAIQQMEEAREKEKEALIPELRFTEDVIYEDGVRKIFLYANNIKNVPVRIHNHYLIPRDVGGKFKLRDLAIIHSLMHKVETDTNEILQFGDAFKVKITLAKLVRLLPPREEVLFSYYIISTTGMQFQCSLFFELGISNLPFEGETHWWVCRFSDKKNISMEEIKKEGKHIASGNMLEVKEELLELKDTN